MHPCPLSSPRLRGCDGAVPSSSPRVAPSLGVKQPLCMNGQAQGGSWKRCKLTPGDFMPPSKILLLWVLLRSPLRRPLALALHIFAGLPSQVGKGPTLVPSFSSPAFMGVTTTCWLPFFPLAHRGTESLFHPWPCLAWLFTRQCLTSSRRGDLRH